ncbi:hypothetical protein EJ06DRAFT_139455 [Trichodelitschia bisporula]|uniref:Uncharacterized protein n=1 Tax=Trichodelitschia bisporula TaxID=703511 RepID=A0A6G1HP58_9PEZI|nr:hypothetical protein EJ06DRAFT_139455 [Trichodelitschia bisporula]
MAQVPLRQRAPTDVLQNSLAYVLREATIGISDARKRKDPGFRQLAHKNIPEAIGQFQGALDKLEADLFRAKAVMRRNLALCQAARLERERAEAAERKRLAGSPTPVKLEADPLFEANGDSFMEDIGSIKQEPVTSSVEPSIEAPDGFGRLIGDTDVKRDDATTSIVYSSPPGSSAKPIAPDQATNKTPGAEDLDLDSIFDGIASASPDKMGLGSSGIALQNFPDNGAVPSLLTGIENYANIPDSNGQDMGASANAAHHASNQEIDITMLDMPAQNGQHGAAGKEEASEEYGNGNSEFTHGDSTFEQMFDWDVQTGGAGDEGELGGEYGDDSWLNGMN